METGTETKHCSAEGILSMAPAEARDFLLELQNRGELETYLSETLKDRLFIAFFSYWEKWFPEDIRRLIDEHVRRWKKQNGVDDERVLPLRLDDRFSNYQLTLIFSSTGAIQLTFGCSKACPHCGFDAVRGVRDTFLFPQLKLLYARYGMFMRRAKPMQYYASEPTDCRCGDYTYPDVYALAIKYAGYRPHITSRNTNDEVWLKFLDSQSKFYRKGVPRVSTFELPLWECHAIKDCLGKESKVEILGRGEAHHRYLGIHAEQHLHGRENLGGIGCFDGMLLTPRGLYNVVQLPISLEFPQGQIIVPFEKFGTDEPAPGMPLKTTMRNAIVVFRRYFHVRLREGLPVFEGKLPKAVYLMNNNEAFRVFHDRRGIITNVEPAAEIFRRATRIGHRAAKSQPAT